MTFIVIRNRGTGEVAIHPFADQAEAAAFKAGALAYALAAEHAGLIETFRLGVHHFSAPDIELARATWPRYFPVEPR